MSSPKCQLCFRRSYIQPCPNTQLQSLLTYYIKIFAVNFVYGDYLEYTEAFVKNVDF